MRIIVIDFIRGFLVMVEEKRSLSDLRQWDKGDRLINGDPHKTQIRYLVLLQ